MVRLGFGRRGVKDVGGDASRQVLWHVIGVVRVPVGLASNDGDAAFGVASRQVRGKVEVEEFVVKGRPSGVSEAGVGPTARILNGAIQ